MYDSNPFPSRTSSIWVHSDQSYDCCDDDDDWAVVGEVGGVDGDVVVAAAVGNPKYRCYSHRQCNRNGTSDDRLDDGGAWREVAVEGAVFDRHHSGGHSSWNGPNGPKCSYSCSFHATFHSPHRRHHVSLWCWC